MVMRPDKTASIDNLMFAGVWGCACVHVLCACTRISCTHLEYMCVCTLLDCMPEASCLHAKALHP